MVGSADRHDLQLTTISFDAIPVISEVSTSPRSSNSSKRISGRRKRAPTANRNRRSSSGGQSINSPSSRQRSTTPKSRSRKRAQTTDMQISRTCTPVLPGAGESSQTSNASNHGVTLPNKVHSPKPPNKRLKSLTQQSPPPPQTRPASNSCYVPQDQTAAQAAVRDLMIRSGVMQSAGSGGDDEPEFPANAIRTSKYTIMTFLPRNLFEQLTIPANGYFLLIAILQLIGPISTSQGVPTILLPLTFVLFVSGLRAALEDRKRHKADAEENNRIFSVWRPSQSPKRAHFQDMASADIHVGDVVKVMDEQTFPADLLLIQVAKADDGYCYVETANIDGETNLKMKQVLESTRDQKQAGDWAHFSASVQIEAPRAALDSFSGRVTWAETGESHVCALDNLLMRGSRLKNSTHCLGVACYTGFETKIFMNLNAKKAARIKQSSIQRVIDKLILQTFTLQVLICFAAAVAAGVWTDNNRQNAWYLAIEDDGALVGLLRFFTWFIIFVGFVPISLLVSMEMVKFVQAVFMQWDLKLMHTLPDGGGDKFCSVNTSSLNEELGLIQYVFSDKTGTLTENCLDFRKCVAGGLLFGGGTTEIGLAAARRQAAAREEKFVEPIPSPDALVLPHVNFDETARIQHLLMLADSLRTQHRSNDAFVVDPASPEPSYLQAYAGADLSDEDRSALCLREFMTALALNHNCFPSLQDDDTIALKASSPDDEALVSFSNAMGVDFLAVDPPTVTLRIRATADQKPRTEQYRLLALLDFTSKRKRMTVVVRHVENGTVKVILKGADSSVRPLLGNPDGEAHLAATEDHLSGLAEEGLRTLMVAGVTLPASWWDDEWAAKYAEAMNECAVEGPEERGHFKGSCGDHCRRCAIEEAVERAAGLELLGATAIEDKLQDGVSETIRALLDGGVKVWVLTGDKLETAVNIGMACSLLDTDMEANRTLFMLTAEDVLGVTDQIATHTASLVQARKQQADVAAGLVMTSKAFSAITTGDEPLRAKFVALARMCKSVVGCRLQPDQKAAILRLVRRYEDGCSCVGIGDGANDEPLIRAADVGIGIFGVEGTAAVRASDYAVGRFKHLHRLLFVYGRLNLRRMSTLVSYIFYKNMMTSLAILFYNFSTGFSGQPMFLEWAFQVYNVVNTGFPILIFAIFDCDLRDTELLENPFVYSLSNRGQMFTRASFWRWVGNGVWHAVVCCFVPLLACANLSDSDGRMYGLWTYGVCVFTLLTVVVNFRLCLEIASWTWLHHFFLWGSIVAYLLWMLVLNASSAWATAGADYNSLVTTVLGFGFFWLLLIVGVVFALTPDFVAKSWHALFNPSASQIFREHRRFGTAVKATD